MSLNLLSPTGGIVIRLNISFLWLLLTNHHKLHDLKQQKSVILQSGRQKSKLGLTRLNSRCWQKTAFPAEAPGEIRCLFYLERLLVFLGSWLVPPFSKLGMEHLQISPWLSCLLYSLVRTLVITLHLLDNPAESPNFKTINLITFAKSLAI